MTRSFVLRGCIVAGLIAILSACASSGPKPAALTKFEPAVKAKVIWRASTDRAGRYRFVPAIRDDAVYAAGSGGELIRLDAQRGRALWRVETKAVLSGGVGLGPDMVLLGTADGEVLAYDLQGKSLWRSRVSSEVLSAPAASASMVVVRSGDGKIYGLDPKDGTRKWEYQATLPSLILRAHPGLVVVNDDAVVAGLPGGKLIVLALSTGALLWEATVATPRGDNELERIADVAGTPLVEPDRICAVTFQGRVGCYETSKGTQIWGRPASSAGGLGADSSAVYYATDTGSVVALDKTAGTSIWTQEKLFQRKVSTPLAFRDWVVVGDYKGYVHFLSREDGSFAARISTDGSEISTQPVAFGDKILVQTNKGGLFAIAITDRKK